MTEPLAEAELDARDQRIAKLIRDGVSHRQIAGQFNTSCSEVTRVRAALGMRRGEMVHRQPAQPATPVVKPLRVKLHLAPMKPEEQFKCEHFACTLTARACVLRQGQRISVRGGKEGHNRFVGKEQRVAIEFQYCANECVQGPAVKEALGGAKVEPPRKVDFQAQHAARRAAMRPEFAPATFADAEIETEPAIPPVEEEQEDGDRSEAEVLAGRRAAQRSAADRRPGSRPRPDAVAAELHDLGDRRGRAGAGAGVDAEQLPPAERREPVPDPRPGDRDAELPLPVTKPKPPPMRRTARRRVDPLVAFERALRRLIVEATRELQRIAKRERRR